MSTKNNYNQRQTPFLNQRGILEMDDKYVKKEVVRLKRKESRQLTKHSNRKEKGPLMNRRRYNTPVRETKQVRVSKHWHEKLKEFSNRKGITISRSLDRICKDFLQDKRNL